ncbi:MAG TPA: type III pantothenate kinase [Bacteroidales bacterium]|nr:type III pantothenate kinase [Bacteroidales bacterium]
MNLIYDVGNTSTKLAVYDKGKKLLSVRSKGFSCEELNKMISPFEINKGIICSVKVLPEFIYDLISVNIPRMHILTHKTKLPFRNEYSTPGTLGPDRIAAVAGAYFMYPGRNILVIDAGTAVTYDYLSGKAYKGGNIAPGLSMRFKALHKFTSKLPLCSAIERFDSPGKNTIQAITAGVINGLIYEINEYIRSFRENNIDSMVILTGGDSGYLKERISFKANVQPDLVLTGLNHILEYNEKGT